MKLHEETQCIGAPGFAGFVPSMKYQFGLTYGNATRHILKTDPSLKKGTIQQEMMAAKRLRASQKATTVTSGDAAAGQQLHNQSKGDDDGLVWKPRNKYATGDDRFSFPPVPGYTGYIPRSQEHFGRAYVESTNSSLADFQRMLRSKNELPPRILALQQKKQQQSSKTSAESTSSGAGSSLPPASQEASAVGKREFQRAIASSSYDTTPYHLPKGHPQKTFISGYTGFVPRLQNHFGQPYSYSVRNAIDEFTETPTARAKARSAIDFEKYRPREIQKTDPIPGFTGFIPGSRTCYSSTFGKTTEIAYGHFNHRDEKGRVPQHGTSLPSKTLAKSMPIPGYRGHIPGYAFSAERSYGLSSKECIKTFEQSRTKLQQTNVTA